jgi:ribonuclease HI
LKRGVGSPKLRAVPYQELLSPEEVLRRFSAGPRTGVFTDGSCEGNPGPGGWGFVWVEDGEIIAEDSGVDPDTTNNRMELTALIAAYRALPGDAEITVYSDSQLCVKTVNEWAAGWEKRGWRRKSGPIANLELVKELYALARAHPKVSLRWIKAHDGSRWNEYADALAAAYMR